VTERLLRGDMGALLSLGGNFAVAGPDSTRVLAALSRCRFTLHIATKLNRTHCHPGQVGLLLPTLGRTDLDLQQGRPQVVSVEDSTSTVRSSRGIQAPLAATMMSEPAIVCGLGQVLVPAGGIDWAAMAGDYGLIREHIERVQRGINDDFADFNRKLAERGRLTLTNSARERQWKTASGKAEFNVHPVPTAGPVARAPAPRQRRAGADDGALARPVQHHRLRPRRPLPRRVRRPARGVHERGRPAGARPARRPVGGPARLRRRGRARARRARLQGGALRHPRRLRGSVLPEATPLLAASNLSLHTRTPAYKDIPVLVRAAAQDAA
jgi:anaerobic selenocysteine-containing dehydrogenase